MAEAARGERFSKCVSLSVRCRVRSNIPPHFCGQKETGREREGGEGGGGWQDFLPSHFFIYIYIIRRVSPPRIWCGCHGSVGRAFAGATRCRHAAAVEAGRWVWRKFPREEARWWMNQTASSPHQGRGLHASSGSSRFILSYPGHVSTVKCVLSGEI